MSTELGRAILNTGVDLSGLQQGLGQADQMTRQRLDALSGGFTKVGTDASRSLASVGTAADTAGASATRSFSGARTAASSFADSLIPIPLGVAGIGLATAGATVAVGKFAVDSVQSFKQFQNQMNEVFTLLPGITDQAMAQMSDDVLTLANDLGILPNDVVPALYQALSAGVPPDNVFEFLRTAGTASIAGITTLETSVDGLTSVVNAYGSELLSTQQASDIFFTTVRLGKTDFGQLSSSISQVTPTAKSAGVAFGDVGAALATITSQGVATNTATTQMRQLFIELTKEGSKAKATFEEFAGVDFSTFLAQGNDLGQAMVILESAAANSDVAVSDLFGSVEAGQAALLLTGGATETFRNNLDQMSVSAGATDTAFQRMDQGATRSFQKLQTAFATLKIETGEALAPLVADIADGLVANMPAITETIVSATEKIRDLGLALSEIPETTEYKVIVNLITGEDGDTGSDVGDWIVDVGKQAGDFLNDVDRASFEAGRSIRNHILGPLAELQQVDIEGSSGSILTFLDGTRATVDDLGAAYDRAAQLASTYFDTQVTGEDIARRYIITSDGVAHSLDGFLQAAVGLNPVLELLVQGQETVGQSALGMGEDIAAATAQANDAQREQVALQQSNAIAAAYASDAVYTLGTAEQVLASSMSAATKEVVLQHMALQGVAGIANEFATAQNAINGVVGAFASQGSQYQAELSAIEGTYAELQERQQAGLSISAEEQQFLNNYPDMYARVEGAIGDAAVREGLAAAAKVELWRAQEDLNTAIENGETDLSGYNDRIKTAQDYLSDVDPASGAAQAIETLNDTMGNLGTIVQDLITALTGLDEVEATPEVDIDTTPFDASVDGANDVLSDFGGKKAEPEANLNTDPFMHSIDGGNDVMNAFEARRPTPQADMDTMSFDEAVSAAEGDIGFLSGLTADPSVDLNTTAFLIAMGAAEGRVAGFSEFSGTAKLYVDTSAVDAAIAYADSLLPHSPAKRGPLSRIPDFGYAFEPMVTAAEYHGNLAARLAASYMPMHSPAEQGPLSSIAPDAWDFLFVGMDRSAEDFAEQAAQKIYDFVSGIDVTTLASGDMLAEANAKLASLFDGRKIAEQMGLGPEILARFDADIAAQQDRIHAIGLAMGTPVVEGIAEALRNGELAEELAEFRLGVFTSTNLNDIFANRDNLQASIVEMTALRDAALEIGDQATADQLTADIAVMNGELEITNQIIGTEAVQAWQAQQDAAAEATKQAQEWADIFTAISDTGGLTKLQQDARDAELALKTAQLQGADPETIARLQANYDEAVRQVVRFEQAMDTAIAAGLYTQEELIEIAAQGGESLKEVIESGFLTPESAMAIAEQSGEGLKAILEAGMLSPEQIDALVANADEGTRAILAAYFGEEHIAAIEDRLAAIDAESYESLRSMVDQGFLSGQDLVTAVADGLASGRLSVQQAMQLLGRDIESISDEHAIALIDTYESLGQDLAQAYASGNAESIAAAQAAWDKFIAYLATIAEASGMTVEEITAHFADLRDAANQTATALSGTSISVGGSASGGASALDRLTGAIRENHQAQLDAAALPIVQAWEDGLITLEEAERRLKLLNDAASKSGRTGGTSGAANAESPLSVLSQSLMDAVPDSLRNQFRDEVLGDGAWWNFDPGYWHRMNAPLIAEAFGLAASHAGDAWLSEFSINGRTVGYDDYETFLIEYFGGDSANFGQAGYEYGTELVRGWLTAHRDEFDSQLDPLNIDQIYMDAIDGITVKLETSSADWAANFVALGTLLQRTGQGAGRMGSILENAIETGTISWQTGMAAMVEAVRRGTMRMSDDFAGLADVIRLPADLMLNVIERLVGGDLERTLADEQLALLQKMQQNPELYGQDLINFVAEQLNATLEGLGYGAETFNDHIRDMLSGAGIELTPEMESQFFPVGNAITDGMAQGIQAGKSQVVNATVDVARAALEAVRDELDIHSPSGVFRRDVGYGGIGMGWLLGIEDAEPELMRATERIADSLFDDWSSRWSAFNLPTLANTVSSLPGAWPDLVTVAPSRGATASPVINQHNHYHVENPSLAVLRNQQEFVNVSLGRALSRVLGGA